MGCKLSFQEKAGVAIGLYLLPSAAICIHNSYFRFATLRLSEKNLGGWNPKSSSDFQSCSRIKNCSRNESWMRIEFFRRISILKKLFRRFIAYIFSITNTVIANIWFVVEAETISANHVRRIWESSYDLESRAALHIIF